MVHVLMMQSNLTSTMKRLFNPVVITPWPRLLDRSGKEIRNLDGNIT